MKVLQINVVCGIRSTGRIATDIYRVLEELAENVKKFIGEETDTKIMGKRAFSIY